MKVALTVPHLVKEFGGPAAKASHLAPALRRLGWDTEVLGCGEVEGATGLGTLGRFHSTPIPRRVRPIVRAVKSAHVVHILGYRDPVGTLAALWARRLSVPYVLEPVGMYGPKLRSHRVKAAYEAVLGSSIVANASLLVATSHIEQQDFEGGGVPPHRVVLRPNGMSVEDLLPLPVPGAFRRSLGIPDSARFVLTIGRISINKGLMGLVEAAAILENVFFAVAGPDNEDGTLQAMRRRVRELDLGHRFFILPGGVWGDEKRQALADADCFCLPSETESFGIAAAEAAGVGLPLVLSDRCGAVPWLLSDATKVFTFGRPDLLAEALQNLLEDKDSRAVAAARASALREELSWDAIALEQDAIYRRVTTQDQATR